MTARYAIVQEVRMKKFAFVAFALQISVLSVFAASTPNECTVCVGAVADLQQVPPSPIPLLLQIRQDDFATISAWIDALSPEQRKKLALIVRYAVDRDKDPLLEVESHTKTIVEWARLHGPFELLGAAVDGADATLSGYAMKQLAVNAQGLNVATRVILPPMSIDDLSKLYDTGAFAYVDALLVDAAQVSKTAAWI